MKVREWFWFESFPPKTNMKLRDIKFGEKVRDEGNMQIMPDTEGQGLQS